MRADRLLSILLLLQTNKKMTAKQLAKELEVSKRTIYRDIDALSGINVPVYTEGGPGGGIYLEENYRVSLTGFSQAELQALFLFSNNRSLQSLGVESAQESAMQKLQATLPQSFQAEVAFLQQRIYIDGQQWYGQQPQQEELFQQLLQAVKQDHQIQLHYLTGQGVMIERVVQPYGLVARSDSWYLVAVHAKTEFRTYKLSRVLSVAELDERFERKMDFDLRRHWQQTTEQFINNVPTYKVWLKADERAWQFIQRYGEKNIYEAGDGVIELWFETIDQARMLLMALGEGFEIVQPVDLQYHLQQYAEQLLTHLNNNKT